VRAAIRFLIDGRLNPKRMWSGDGALAGSCHPLFDSCFAFFFAVFSLAVSLGLLFFERLT
jgi:hypothetical protein